MERQQRQCPFGTTFLRLSCASASPLLVPKSPKIGHRKAAWRCSLSMHTVCTMHGQQQRRRRDTTVKKKTRPVIGSSASTPTIKHCTLTTAAEKIPINIEAQAHACVGSWRRVLWSLLATKSYPSEAVLGAAISAVVASARQDAWSFILEAEPSPSPQVTHAHARKPLTRSQRTEKKKNG